MRCLTPLNISNPRFEKMPWLPSRIEVPCGKCPACKQRRASSWMFRLKEECKIAMSAHFLTLTYATDHVPISSNGLLTLCPSHLQDYWKRLRYFEQSNPLKILYYACGEYGEMNERPHYHAIVFNVSDLESCYKAWPFGNFHAGKVTDASISYVCGYMNKPPVTTSLDEDDRVKEFQRMSKGLGLKFLSRQMVKYYKDDLTRLFVTLPGGVRLPMPRYYRDRIFSPEERKIIAHYLYWSDKWSDDVRPSFDQVKHMFDRYKAKYAIAAKRRL